MRYEMQTGRQIVAFDIRICEEFRSCVLISFRLFPVMQTEKRGILICEDFRSYLLINFLLVPFLTFFFFFCLFMKCREGQTSAVESWIYEEFKSCVLITFRLFRSLMLPF